MPISQQGSINTTSLIVPDLYVQIVAPQNLVLNGVPTNIVGVVGTASWGPVDEPSIVGTMADYAQQFGSIIPRKHDMGTQVATAVQQGAQNFRCIRVTDATDTAAYTVVPGSNASQVVCLRPGKVARYLWIISRPMNGDLLPRVGNLVLGGLNLRMILQSHRLRVL